MPEKNLVIIPTYNEKGNVEKMITTVLKLSTPFDILIVDDNSPDKTYEIVETLIKSHTSQLHILKRAKKNGLGPAYIAGFKWALKNQYTHIFEMDCDFSHNPKDLVTLHKTLSANNCDVVVGSRYKVGINVVNWSFKRVCLSFGASKYVQFITRLPIKDPTSGFVGYTANALNALNFSKINE